MADRIMTVKLLALGFLVPLTVLVIGTGATASLWEGPFLGTFGRVLDSLAPHLLAMALVLCLLVAALSAVRTALVLAALALVSGTVLARDHLAHTVPVAVANPTWPHMTAIWFNLFEENPTPPARLVEAIATSGADLVILAEAAPVCDTLADLAETFPYQMGCGRHPGILVLSRLPFDADSPELVDISRPERLVRFRIRQGNGVTLAVLAVHLAKPWFYGFVESDMWYVGNRLSQLDGPVLAVGDFNAAAWSRPLDHLLDDTGLRSPRRPVPTWPASSGGFGIPIDHMLVRGGARLTSLEPWGAELGSNHRGLRADVIWPPE